MVMNSEARWILVADIASYFAIRETIVSGKEMELDGATGFGGASKGFREFFTVDRFFLESSFLARAGARQYFVIASLKGEQDVSPVANSSPS